MSKKKFSISGLFCFLGVVFLLMSFDQSSKTPFDLIHTARDFSKTRTRDIKQEIDIVIKEQNEFDELQITITQLILEGRKRIAVRFTPGTYFFKEHHLILNNLNYPDVSIRFVGKECVFSPYGHKIDIHNIEYPLDYTFSYTSLEGKDLDLWSSFNSADSLIQVIDEKDKLCRLFVGNSVKVSFNRDSWIQFTEWYNTRVCKIERLDNGYIYFRVPELFRVKGEYNVNYDYVLKRKMPRYRIFCSGEGDDLLNFSDIVYVGEAGTFCEIHDSHFSRISFEDIRVNGNIAKHYLFSICNTSFNDCFLIYNCVFSGQRGGVVGIENSCNIFIQKCNFENQYSTIIESDGLSENTEIFRNTFTNCGKWVTNSNCVFCRGKNYYVAENQFVDYGYCAIRCGLWYKEVRRKPSNGIVESNVLYYTDEYAKNKKEYGLIDGGAVYIATKNDELIIRYNFINNYSGPGSNRGIYCDDGAYGFSIYGNVLININNSNFIDSRKVNLKGLPTNTNNYVGYNIIGGNYKFVGASNVDSNVCIKQMNIILYKDNNNDFEIVVDNIKDVEEDIYLPYKSTKDLSIIVPRSTRRQLKELFFYNYIKKYIKLR